MTTSLVKIDANRNMARTYVVDVQPNLFGGWSVKRTWARIGTRGQSRISMHSNQALATAEAARLLTGKRRRGYAERPAVGDRQRETGLPVSAAFHLNRSPVTLPITCL